MRKEKLEELNDYIKELKTVKRLWYLVNISMMKKVLKHQKRIYYI